MAKTIPFQILRDLAHESQQKAFEAVGRATAQERAAIEQMAKLQQYRHDYLQKMQETMQNGVRSSVAYNTQRFIDNIDSAISKQQQQIKMLGENVAKRRQEWVVERRKVESMSTLLNRHDKKQTLQANRREQKQNDEYAARAYRRMQMA